MSTPSLYTLPIELLHRILDHVDTETVFLSFRNVCKYFHAIIESYNQYKLDFRSITKRAFHRLRHFIQPENVVSLILSDDHRTSGQINLFLSLFDLNTFTRLRSVTLIQINGADLIVYLKHISTCSIVSLTVSKRKFGNTVTTTETKQMLMHCPIRHLSLTQWSSLREILDIFLHFPYLETLLLDSIVMPNLEENSVNPVPVKSQLKSLTISFYTTNMNMIMSALSCTPSLVHLKLIGCPRELVLAWDGYWWAEFIQKNLPELQFFEFFFDKRIDARELTCDIESIITSFRTPFWFEKRWYITCDYYRDTHELNLYSIPICKSTILYKPAANKISCSNAMNDTPYIMDNVRSLTLNSIPATVDTCDRISLSNYPLFSRVTKLSLLITNHFSNGSIDYLSNLIDLSRVDNILLILDLSEESCNAIQMILSSLFNRTSNLQSLHLSSTRSSKLILYWKIISPIIPNQVKNLTFDIFFEGEIQWILDRFENFSSITFQSKSHNHSIFDQIIDKITNKRKNFTYLKNYEYASVWFGE